MSGDTPSVRPWWVASLGVGSVSLGSLQCLGALGMVYAAAELGGRGGTTFLLLAAAWFLPGALLAASGVGVLAGYPWARRLSLAAVGAMAISLLAVMQFREAIPPAVADFVEFGGRTREAGELVGWLRSHTGGDPVALLRDPSASEGTAWVFTGECGCGGPWYLLVLAVCVLPAGRRMVNPTPSGEDRSAAP